MEARGPRSWRRVSALADARVLSRSGACVLRRLQLAGTRHASVVDDDLVNPRPGWTRSRRRNCQAATATKMPPPTRSGGISPTPPAPFTSPGQRHLRAQRPQPPPRPHRRRFRRPPDADPLAGRAHPALPLPATMTTRHQETSTQLPDRESRLTGVGESEGLYLVGWKTERGEHAFNGVGLALQVQAV